MAVGVGVGHLCHSFVGGQGAVCGRVAFCKVEVRRHPLVLAGSKSIGKSWHFLDLNSANIS